MKDRQVAAVFLIFMVFIGMMISPDFGISWDEPDNIVYGEQALKAYATLKVPKEWHSNLESKGPFFIAVADGLSALMTRLIRTWDQFQARHFIYFLSYMMGMIAFFALARKLVGTWAAITATLLFTTQPMLFGHAFINPKDIPFLGFFIVTVTAGVYSVDLMQSGLLKLPGMLGIFFLIGVLNGITMGIRLFGFFAGLLVAIYGFSRLRRKYLSLGILQMLVAILIMWLSWPYLWTQPISHFLQSVKIMLDFPWDNLVLYRGLLYPAELLPWHYLPFITVIQLTLPLLVTAVLGGLSVSFHILKGGLSEKRVVYTCIVLWIAIPYGFSLIAGSTVYDNSRQFLFALPPVGFLSAPIFEKIYVHYKNTWIKLALLVIILIPGILGIIQLHPYEYIFYNSLVGGVKGAYRTYELDYWATSYREAMELINMAAPPDSNVEVIGPWMSAAYFARPDLNTMKFAQNRRKDTRAITYFIIPTRTNADIYTLDDIPVSMTVEKSGATLAVIKQLVPDTDNH